MEILDSSDAPGWMEVLGQCDEYDFYHLPEYHALAGRRGEGVGRLFVCHDHGSTIALPLLIRSVGDVEGLEAGAFRDASSVYGYCGPIASRRDLPQKLVEAFRDELTAELRRLNVVAVFSRLHPLLSQTGLVSGLGECHTLGQTISIDLTQSADAQTAAIRPGHRYEIRKLRKQGIECVHDEDGRYLDAFIDLYAQTMRRVGAADDYFFEPAYFRSLMQDLRGTFHLFVALLNGDVISGALFTECRRIVQYHLSGTRDAFVKQAPTKLILDTVRIWATERHQRVFHLGGGVGSREDSLFRFKAGFSDRRHEFSVWRWIVMPDAYDDLSARKEAWGKARGFVPVASSFFPRYRGSFAPATAQ